MIFNGILALISWTAPLSPAPAPIPVTLECAFDQESKNWGLMQRSSLPNDYGMLFDFGTSKRISLWSFNCLMDLEVAFLDHRGVIQEIATLKAFPEMMDPQRPVASLRDFYKYPPNDPIRRFFSEWGITSKTDCRYALEVAPAFFKQRSLSVGDLLIWNASAHKGLFLHPIELNDLMPLPINETIGLQMQATQPIALRAPNSFESYHVQFYDANHRLVISDQLSGKPGIKPQDRAIIYCPSPVYAIRIANTSLSRITE